MSRFNPAYQHGNGSNDVWLNDVVGDTVSDAQPRRGSSVSRSWSSGDFDSASSVEGNDATKILSHMSRTRTRGSLGQISECRTTSAIAKNREARRQTTRPGIEGERSTQDPSDSTETSGSPRSSHPPARDPMRRQKDESEIPSDAFPTLEKHLSTVCEFSEFQPHPAVRSLEPHEVSGEAAGASNGAGDDYDDDAGYPGPLALSLIVLGICLSVFTISLDRNIITTVGISQSTPNSHHKANHITPGYPGNHGRVSFI